MKKIFVALLSLLFIIMLSTPSFAATDDIVDIAVGNEDFSILVAALTEAELVEALQAEGPFTVFAPTDAAFADLLAALDISAEDLLAQPGLADVLLYHVVSGKVMSTDLTDGMMPETLLGETVTIDLDGGVMVNESMVVTADIEATNGVIHVIDSVLVPGAFVLEEPETMDEPVVMPYTGASSVGGPLTAIGMMLLTALYARKRES